MARSEDARLRDVLRMVQERIESCEKALSTVRGTHHFVIATHLDGEVLAYREVEAMIERKLK